MSPRPLPKGTMKFNHLAHYFDNVCIAYWRENQQLIDGSHVFWLIFKMIIFQSPKEVSSQANEPHGWHDEVIDGSVLCCGTASANQTSYSEPSHIYKEISLSVYVGGPDHGSCQLNVLLLRLYLTHNVKWQFSYWSS